MTNITLPKNARRAIIALAKKQHAELEEAAFRIAMDACQDFPVSEDDDENEHTIKIAILQIERETLARISLAVLVEAMLETE